MNHFFVFCGYAGTEEIFGENEVTIKKLIKIIILINLFNHRLLHSKTIWFDLAQYPFTPLALGEVLETFKTLYGNPPIFIHENGMLTSRSRLH